MLERDVYPNLTAQLLAGTAKHAGIPMSRITRLKSYQALMAKSDTIIRDGMTAAKRALTTDLKGLAGVEANFAKRAIAGELGVSLGLIAPNIPILNAIVTSQPFQGQLLGEWFSGLKTAAQRRVRSAVNIGLAQGESNQAIARRLKSALKTTSRQATTIARTATTHVSNQAREATYSENKDVVKGVRYIATLDARTSDICASLDGRVFPVNEGERPPMHHQCRSTTVPVLKSWKELGLPLKEGQRGSRAASSFWRSTPKKTKEFFANLSAKERRAMRLRLEGQVPAKQTYGTWLRSQTAAMQNEVLGTRRGLMFRQGRIGVKDLVNAEGRTLTLAELEAAEMRIGSSFGGSKMRVLYTKGDLAALDVVPSLDRTLAMDKYKRAATLVDGDPAAAVAWSGKGAQVELASVQFVESAQVQAAMDRSLMWALDDALRTGKTMIYSGTDDAIFKYLVDHGFDAGAFRQPTMSALDIIKLRTKLSAKYGVKDFPQRLWHKSLGGPGRVVKPKPKPKPTPKPEPKPAHKKRVVKPDPEPYYPDNRRAVLEAREAESATHSFLPNPASPNVKTLLAEFEKLNVQGLDRINERIQTIARKQRDIYRKTQDYMRHGGQETAPEYKLFQRKRTQLAADMKEAEQAKETVTNAANKVFHEAMLVKDPVTIELKFANAVAPWEQSQALEAAKFMGDRLSASTFGTDKITIKVARTRRSRSSYTPGRLTINMALHAPTKTFVHELAHALDDTLILGARKVGAPNSPMNMDAIAFLKRRTAGEQVQKLRDITGISGYARSEVAWKDDFIEYYMGRDYRGQATECFSMAAEMLFTDPAKLARLDSDMFEWMIRHFQGLPPQ